MRLEEDPALHRPTDVPELRGDPSRIHHDTGWAPEITLDATLADLLDDWRRRLREPSPAD
jgi:GDP-4-dehydro-6-deoxy-D-mannose reductase